MQQTVQTQFSVNGTQVRIRPLVEEDLPALEWDGAFTHFRRLYAQHYRNMIKGNTLVWVSETEERELVGQLFLLLYSQQKEVADGFRRAYIFSFRIKPAYRNQGLGSFMLALAENDLMLRGFTQVRLNVARQNRAARQLYERLGYRVIGSDPGVWHYQDPQGEWQSVREPAWKMLKELGSRNKAKRKV